MVYPTMRLSGEWGSLEVDSVGALLTDTHAAVSAKDLDTSSMAGEGWRLTLDPAWSVQPGERTGDLIVRRKPADDGAAQP